MTVIIIPGGVNNVSVDLLSASAVDLRLWDGETLVVGSTTDVDGLIYAVSREAAGDYKGVTITYSGRTGVAYSGDYARREYIRFEGLTQNSFTVRVTNTAGRSPIRVEYSWLP